MVEFLGQTAAVYRRFGQDAKAQGYRLVFTDIGAESMEEGLPDFFASLLAEASGGGVCFKGFSKAVVDATSVRDKKTGEKGVCFLITDRQEHAGGGFEVSAEWYERDGALHDVTYHLFKDGAKWKAE